MLNTLRQWFHRYFSDPEAVLLFFILILGVSLIMFMGNILAPVLASIVIAYLLDGIVTRIQATGVPHLPAVLITYLGFIGLFLVCILVLLPLLWRQLASLFNELPNMMTKIQQGTLWLQNSYPQYFSAEQTQELLGSVISDMRNWGKVVISASLSSIASLITWVVYLVLVPLLVFFFLKDKNKLTGWVASFLPNKRGVLQRVSREVNQQIGNYIRGKVTEIFIVGIATYIVFWFFDLQYASLLAALVGFSVIIPYIGIVVISLPVALVAYLQFGFNPEFGYLILVYSILQGLDANLLVPLLFSEAVNLHPVAIIVATLFFGSIWGFWGVFFAIPLATLVKAVLHAWPKKAH